MVAPEDPIAVVPRGPGRPVAAWAKADQLAAAMQGGMSAIRQLLYEITKEMLREGKKRKLDQVRMDGWYLRGKLLGVLNDNDERGAANMDKIEKLISDLKKEVDPEVKKEEKPGMNIWEKS